MVGFRSFAACSNVTVTCAKPVLTSWLSPEIFYLCKFSVLWANISTNQLVDREDILSPVMEHFISKLATLMTLFDFLTSNCHCKLRML